MLAREAEVNSGRGGRLRHRAAVYDGSRGLLVHGSMATKRPRRVATPESTEACGILAYPARRSAPDWLDGVAQREYGWNAEPIGLRCATHADSNATNRGPRSTAYSYPRVIHRSEESPQELLPAASVNNSAAPKKVLAMNVIMISHNWENTHRPATNSTARRWTPNGSPSSQAMRWSLTNTQWRTAAISRSHYKPFAGISQRVFAKGN